MTFECGLCTRACCYANDQPPCVVIVPWSHQEMSLADHIELFICEGMWCLQGLTLQYKVTKIKNW